jgi:polysaccharide biosynthesis/export protein
MKMKKNLSWIIGILVIIMFGFSLSYAQETKATPGQGSSANPIPVDSDKYVITQEDVLSILVWKEDALSQQVTVRTDGKISLPLIDEVQAAGLTPLQLRDQIVGKLKGFVENPVVTVIVKQPRPIKVYISGQIEKPGEYELLGDVSFLQLISLAGGFTLWANQKKIILIQKDGDKEMRSIVNYKNIVTGDAPNFILKRGDVVIVND